MPDVKFSNLYPYTDFHELNLDWVIKEVKYWSTKVGKTIQSIELTGTVGLVDTYTINYSDGSTSTFDVTNGNGIASVDLTSSSGNVDYYTITMQNGDTEVFTVTNSNVDAVRATINSASSVTTKSGSGYIQLDDSVFNNPVDVNVIPAGSDTSAVLTAYGRNMSSISSLNWPQAFTTLVDFGRDVSFDSFTVSLNINGTTGTGGNIIQFLTAGGTATNRGMSHFGIPANTTVNARYSYTITNVTFRRIIWLPVSYSGTTVGLPLSVIQLNSGTSTKFYPIENNNVTVDIPTMSGWQSLILYDDRTLVVSSINADLTVKYVRKTQPNVTRLEWGTGKQYTKLRDALAACELTSENNQYIIDFFGDGTEYDLSSEYTAAELNNPTFVGMIIPDHVTINGVTGKDNCIIGLRLGSPHSYLSTINLSNGASLKHLTLIGNNTRYVVHDDFRQSTDVSGSVEDCVIDSISSALNVAYGSGVVSGCTRRFIGTVFNARAASNRPFSCHNNVDFTKPATLYFENCRFISTTYPPTIQTIDSSNVNNIINNAIFVGNKSTFTFTFGGQTYTTGWEFMPNDSAQRGMLWKASGYANTFESSDVMLANTDGVDYSDYVDVI